LATRVPSGERMTAAALRNAGISLDKGPAALDAGSAGKMVESVGSGYLPPHQASLVGSSAEVRYAAGVDSGMIAMQG